MTKIFKGNILFTPTPEKFTIIPHGHILVSEGKVKAVYQKLPEEYRNLEIIDYQDKLIIPGMNDLHCHASQYKHMGMAMDRELIPWLENYTFPEEAKFQDIKYAEKIYQRFIKEIWKQGTTRIVVFATVHKESTMKLLDMFIQSGLGAYVGKVNMDNNCPDYICETLEDSLKDTEEIIIKYGDKSSLVKPIITPRFAPSCSKKLLKGLGDLGKKHGIPVQSHLSENRKEVQWVKELFPDADSYGDVYKQYGLFGDTPTLMAHCSLSSEEEMTLMRENNVLAVHCPASNLNVGSGMMPIRKFINRGIKLGLGSDLSGGHTPSLMKTMVYAIQTSKIFWVNSEKQMDFLTNSEAFFIATKGGGSFFGKVGSFEEGYDFDALIIDDGELNYLDYTLEERLERFIYVGDDRHILHRYVRGSLIKEPVL
ncbi:guanine deaminase [Dehalobacterium formicoaceticum]|uniref:Guanine deaminase n=1 Tax=Dehalobacterium formicoaceticum TaxID=51515 RepID=A0ABT1Y8Q9_9FIRM|nr:guanine deaminase [Dehalobacterium formicoaceticum]MCR6546279.1 guanine deaminase [Dehalobacterium formicoaceticum]